MRQPSFGYLAGIVVLLLLFPMFIIFDKVCHPITPKGFYIRVPNIYAEHDAMLPTLMVRLDQQKRFHFSGGRIPIEDTPLLTSDELQSTLRLALAQRPDHFVYFNADSELTWAEAVDAMELIRQCGGDVILIPRR